MRVVGRVERGGGPLPCHGRSSADPPFAGGRTLASASVSFSPAKPAAGWVERPDIYHQQAALSADPTRSRRKSKSRPANKQRSTIGIAIRFLLITIFTFAGSSSSAEPPLAVTPVTTDGTQKTRHAWSPDGKSLAYVKLLGSTMTVQVREADGRERRLTDFASPEFDPAWSPDGSRLAIARDITSPNQGNIDVFTVSVGAGGEARRIAGEPGKLSHEESPAWSPDGRSLVFSSTRNDKQQLYIASADGGEARPLTADNSMNAHPSWSPDGRHVAFATARWGDWELAITDVDGKETRRLTDSRGLDDYPAWSPDGKRLAFVSNRAGDQGIADYEIYVLDPATGAVRNISQHPSLDQFPAFTPDGRLSWVSLRNGGHDIVVTDRPLAN